RREPPLRGQLGEHGLRPGDGPVGAAARCRRPPLRRRDDLHRQVLQGSGTGRPPAVQRGRPGRRGAGTRHRPPQADRRAAPLRAGAAQADVGAAQTPPPAGGHRPRAADEPDLLRPARQRRPARPDVPELTETRRTPSMRVGIEKANLYGGRAYLTIADLASARGGSLDALERRQMVPYEARSIIPPYEDSVTLAVNATERLLSDADREQIELVVVATESAVDFGKPISTWVQRFSRLPAHSRNFEVKHMCYGGTAALR